MKRTLYLLAVLGMVAVLVLSGCAKKEAPPVPAPAPKPAPAPAPKPAPAPAPKPAPAPAPKPTQPPDRAEPKLTDLEQEVLDWTEDVIKSIRAGEVAAIIRMNKAGFTVELGEHIKETKIVSARL